MAAKGEAGNRGFVPGAIVSHVAQRHWIKPQQLFDWRRRVREHDPGAPARFARPCQQITKALELTISLFLVVPKRLTRISLGFISWGWNNREQRYG
jgi:transposase-like protein